MAGDLDEELVVERCVDEAEQVGLAVLHSQLVAAVHAVDGEHGLPLDVYDPVVPPLFEEERVSLPFLQLCTN